VISYIFYFATEPHLESEIRQKNRQIDDLTIALKQEQSLNLNSQNILSNTKKNRN
jgi:hypothetical protein